MVKFLLATIFSALVLALGVEPARAQQAPKIAWQRGPLLAKLGAEAEINVPEGYLFTDQAGTQTLLQITQNPSDGDEVGAVVPASKNENYFVLFEFHPVGYVSDSDQSDLDANALLTSITNATEKDNDARRAKGWSAFHVRGWAVRPFYSAASHHLVWGILGAADGDKGETVNYSTRILGRHGTMNVDLVIDASQYQAAVPQVDSLLSGFSFQPGSRYSEFRKGDKVAGYGLAALVAGGAAATAVKLGLFSKLWKFLLAGFLGLLAFIKRLWRRLTGGEEFRPSADAPDEPAK